ncbi:MAG: insulinase family protein [Armatimonadetes bacterium]|nr:insulinase family protein [Armatimonadota bacterium]
MAVPLLDTPVRESTLPNGLRVITETVPHVYSVALGIRVASGSRDEPEELAGISHLLEHMVFKGTERRTAAQIAVELDSVGGQVDAFTSKEYAGYSARVLAEHVPLALDVLTDMLCCSTLDQAELDLEKGVILEEYRGLEDAPEEWVHELYCELLWPDHPLGRPVIGRPEVIEALTREDLIRHRETHYVPDQLICVASGQVEHDEFVGWVAEHLRALQGRSPAREERPPRVQHSSIRMDRPLEQVHLCLGTGTVGERHPDRWPLRVLNLILGGGMSSRLFQEIREKRGLCYSIGSDVTTFREGGCFTVYADTSPEHGEEVQDLVWAEVEKIAEQGLTEEELARAKAQVRAGTLLSLEDTGSRMNRLARSVLYYGKVIPLSELVGFVEAVTREDCRRVAGDLISRGEFAFAAIGPFGKEA